MLLPEAWCITMLAFLVSRHRLRHDVAAIESQPIAPIPDHQDAPALVVSASNPSMTQQSTDRLVTVPTNNAEQVPSVTVSQPPTFFCSIHQESHPETVEVRIEPCAHPFCRDGLKEYIRSKLQDRQVPGLCPMCMAGDATAEGGQPQSSGFPTIFTETYHHLTPVRPGIKPDMAHKVGLSDRDAERWADLEMKLVCVEIRCPKYVSSSVRFSCLVSKSFGRCGRSVFVDRRECQSSQIGTCPMQNCNHRWCKICNIPVPTGIEHSCDGTAEVEQLARLNGWKKCPGMYCTLVVDRYLADTEFLCRL